MKVRLGLAVLALLAAGDLRAQSLGEVAAKEKERRQQADKQPARVVTEEELAEAAAERARTAPSPEATPARKPTGSSKASSGPATEIHLPSQTRREQSTDDLESANRERLAAHYRAQLAAAEQEVERAKKAVEGAESWYEHSRRGSRTRDYYEERIKDAQERLKRAEDYRDSIEAAARQAGLYPGDLR